MTTTSPTVEDLLSLILPGIAQANDDRQTLDELIAELKFGGFKDISKDLVKSAVERGVKEGNIVPTDGKYELSGFKSKGDENVQREKGYLSKIWRNKLERKEIHGASLEGEAKRVKVNSDMAPPAEGAYARLYGKCLKSGSVFNAYITDLPCYLGREHIGQQENNFISLGASKQISRVHACIDYDYNAGCYTIEPTGKNSITVRKVQYSPKDMKGSKKISIMSKDPIRIGNIGFYFLRSTFEKPKEAYAELAKRVFENLPPGTVLGTRNVCEKIIEENIYFQANYSTPDAFAKLMNSLQQALRRSSIFMRCGNKQRAEWKLRGEDVKEEGKD